ncbi:hypothetical protein PM082_023936 [Marasmius tenuissimus]|nr:hypothetical protein PM082_023936 [Marasmius tenuissimus]
MTKLVQDLITSRRASSQKLVRHLKKRNDLAQKALDGLGKRRFDMREQDDRST